jgi:tRNA(Ile)-lysidine synthase
VSLSPILRTFFTQKAPLAPGEVLLVAFSGGPDSTALLAAVAEVAASRGFSVVAAHLDHAQDPGSGERAERARALARHLCIPFHGERRRPDSCPGESPEAAARRVRYAFLEETRQRRGARWIATAHHADDQAETLLLRWLQGTQLEGLAGIQPVRGRIVRPLLEVPRSRLAGYLETLPLEPSLDPSNRDFRQPRSRVRHALLPHLAEEVPDLSHRLSRLAASVRRGRRRWSQALLRALEPVPAFGGEGIPIARFLALPEGAQTVALALLHRRAGATFPAGEAARSELRRQLQRGARGPRLGCDGGDGWRWEGQGDLLVLRRSQAPPPFFTYTFEIPGVREIPELSMRMSVRRAREGERVSQRELKHLPPEPRPTLRAALALPLDAGAELVVRNRLPGDRIQPLGSRSRQRLKEVLIDRRVPRLQRDFLPLLLVAGRIAWVPGVTIDASVEVTDPRNVWIAKIEPI